MLSELSKLSKVINYQLIRSARRKTLGLQVKSGQVIVRAPTYLAQSYIDDFIQSKSTWLSSKVAEHNSRSAVTLMNFTHGSFIWFHGETKPLIVDFQSKPQVLNFDDKIKVVLSQRSRDVVDTTLQLNKLAIKVKKQLEQWFKQQAHEYISVRLAVLSEETQLFAQSFNIRQYQARWGSCNSRGELSFNYLLMMTPQWVIDYVIVHELCHLVHMNHSAKFWQLVAQHFPRYREARTWLKAHQSELAWRLI